MALSFSLVLILVNWTIDVWIMTNRALSLGFLVLLSIFLLLAILVLCSIAVVVSSLSWTTGPGSTLVSWVGRSLRQEALSHLEIIGL